MAQPPRQPAAGTQPSASLDKPGPDEHPVAVDAQRRPIPRPRRGDGPKWEEIHRLRSVRLHDAVWEAMGRVAAEEGRSKAAYVENALVQALGYDPRE